MKQYIGQITLVVGDYDEAIQFYTEKLNFILIEDVRLSETKRWVIIVPPGSSECGLLLAKAVGEEQMSRIGNQTGGRVFLFLYTDDFDRDYKDLLANQIQIIRDPKEEEYGKVLVFADLYGNQWDLIAKNNFGV